MGREGIYVHCPTWGQLSNAEHCKPHSATTTNSSHTAYSIRDCCTKKSHTHSPSNCSSFKASVCIFWALLFIPDYHPPCSYLWGSHLIHQFNYQLMLLFPKLLGTPTSFKLSNLIFTVFSTHIKLIMAFHACFFSQFPLKIVLSYWSLKCCNTVLALIHSALSYFLTNRNLLSLTRDPHESLLILISIMTKTLKGLKHLLYKRLRAPGLFCLRNGKPWGNLYLVYKYLVREC